MGKYAAKTQVSSAKSKAEIETILRRYGATEFLYGARSDVVVVAFRMFDRQVRFTVPMPSSTSDEFIYYERGGVKYSRSDDAAYKLYEQAIRQRWRALALVIKAKLEAVESGITEFEDEFLAHIVLPGGQTMGQLAKPQIKMAYESGEVPRLLSYMDTKSTHLLVDSEQ